MPKEKQTKL